MTLPRLFTVREIAAITHAPESTVRYWLYSGKIASRRVGRRRLVTEGELRTFLRVDAVIR